MNLCTALLVFSVISSLPTAINASQDDQQPRHIGALTAKERRTFLYLERSLMSDSALGSSGLPVKLEQLQSIERYQQKILQQYNFARMLVKEPQALCASKIKFYWIEQTAERIKRDEFLSYEKQLKRVVNHLGPLYFANPLNGWSGRQEYETEMLKLYNRARGVIGHSSVKSFAEVDLKWIKKKAKELTPSSTTSQLSTVCNISGLDRKQVVQALFTAASHQGMGVLGSSQDRNNKLTDEEATSVIQDKEVGYLKGRSMKLNFGGDQLDVTLYNRDNGDNAAQEVLNELRGIASNIKELKIVPPVIADLIAGYAAEPKPNMLLKPIKR